MKYFQLFSDTRPSKSVQSSFNFVDIKAVLSAKGFRDEDKLTTKIQNMRFLPQQRNCSTIKPIHHLMQICSRQHTLVNYLI